MPTSPPVTHAPQQIASVGELDPENPKDRLLQAMAAAIVEKGFATTVVADVVRIARVSRRTFYEHFTDRSDCFLELCDRSTRTGWQIVEEAADLTLPWQEQTSRAVDAYVEFMTAEPAITRSFLFEIFATGERGAEKSREIQHRFAEQFAALVSRARDENPRLQPVSYPMASAIVAGICELIMLSLEPESGISKEDVKETAIQFVLGVVNAAE